MEQVKNDPTFRLSEESKLLPNLVHGSPVRQQLCLTNPPFLFGWQRPCRLLDHLPLPAQESSLNDQHKTLGICAYRPSGSYVQSQRLLPYHPKPWGVGVPSQFYIPAPCRSVSIWITTTPDTVLPVGLIKQGRDSGWNIGPTSFVRPRKLSLTVRKRPPPWGGGLSCFYRWITTTSS